MVQQKRVEKVNVIIKTKKYSVLTNNDKCFTYNSLSIHRAQEPVKNTQNIKETLSVLLSRV